MIFHPFNTALKEHIELDVILSATDIRPPLPYINFDPFSEGARSSWSYIHNTNADRKNIRELSVGKARYQLISEGRDYVNHYRLSERMEFFFRNNGYGDYNVSLSNKTSHEVIGEGDFFERHFIIDAIFFGTREQSIENFDYAESVSLMRRS